METVMRREWWRSTAAEVPRNEGKNPVRKRGVSRSKHEGSTPTSGPTAAAQCVVLTSPPILHACTHTTVHIQRLRGS
jgi:hypothetical protein